MTVVTPTDHPKSARNRCVIEVFGGVFVFSPVKLTFIFRDGMGVNVMIPRFFIIFGRPSISLCNLCCLLKGALVMFIYSKLRLFRSLNPLLFCCSYYKAFYEKQVNESYLPLPGNPQTWHPLMGMNDYHYDAVAK